MQTIQLDLKKIAVWASAYLDPVLFALVGGFFYLKSDDESVKKTCVQALKIKLLFIGITVLFNVIDLIGSMFKGYYGSDFYSFMNKVDTIYAIARIVVYVVFMIRSFLVKVAPASEK